MPYSFQQYYKQESLWDAEVVAPHGAVANEIIALLPKDAGTILDVGCGNGAISNAITDRHVIGSDIALAAIKHMRHPACLADICDMPFPDHSFDLVMATDVLEHIPDRQYAKACAELERISRRWIMIAVPYRELLDSASVECGRCGTLYHVHWHQRSYDETFVRGHWSGRAAVARWGLAGERWIWSSQAVLDLKHAAAGRNYDFPQAVCPECGTVRGEGASPLPIEREFESLQYSLVEAGAALPPPRSELLALFDKQTKRHARFPKPQSKPRLPHAINPRELVCRENPEAYPYAHYTTDVRHQSFVLGLPSLPKALECPGVEAALFDGVTQSYQRVLLNGRDPLPDVRPTRFGYFLRIHASISSCPVLLPIGGARDARVLHAGGVDTDTAAKIKNEAANAAAALECGRETAEKNALAAMRSAAALEKKLERAEREAAQLEARRAAAERVAQDREAAAAAAESRIEVLLDASNKAEAARVAAESAAQALASSASQAEEGRQFAERVAQDREAAAAAAESRIEVLLDASERIERLRAAAEAAVEGRDLALADARLEIASLFDAGARAQQDASAAAQKADLAELRARSLEDEIDQEKAANLEITWLLDEAMRRESALRQRLTAEGAMDKPRLRALARRYKRALIETLDLLTVWRARPRVREWPSQVVVVSHMYPRENNRVGGIFVHDQVKALRAKGIDVRVLSGEPFWCNARSPVRLLKALVAYLRTPARETVHEGVPVTFFPWFVGAWVPAWAQSWTYSHGLMRVVKHWKKDRPVGIVHAHTANLDGSAGRRAADWLGVPLFLTEHTGPFDILTQHPMRRRRTRAAVRAADRVFAVSSALRGDMIRTLGTVAQRVEVLPNGVDLETFTPAARKEKRRATRALWIGHHVPVKRIDRLLPAFADALSQTPDLTLSLLGGGELLEKTKEHAWSLGLQDKVTFLPPADRDGVAQHIRDHDYVVISSETETFALVALEAMACGKPVLSTACGGPQDILLNSRLGMIVENSQEGLTQGLVAMADRAELFDPKHIRAHVARNCSWKAVVDRLTEAYVAAHQHRK